MKKIILFLLFLLCSITIKATENNTNPESNLINPIWISSVTVNAVCNTPTSITYTYTINLCDIYLPVNNIYIYISPEPGNTWSYVGNATQVGSNDYLFTVTQNSNVILNPGSWVIMGLYSYIDPSTIFPGNGTSYCSSRKLFNMPNPTGNCVATCPWIQTVRLFDNSYINNSGASPNNYSNYTNNCIPLIQSPIPQINITPNQPNVFVALLIDLDGNGVFNVGDYFNTQFITNPSGVGFGLPLEVANGTITGGELVRVIVSDTPITLSNDIPICGEAEDYILCCTALPTTITATVGTNQVDITNTLTATIPCGQNCITLNATNITNAVYNTSSLVLTDLMGRFCLPPGSTLTSFIATITGTDSCGNPYYEEVLVNIQQGCCTDVPYIQPYWNHPNCPINICDPKVTQWPVNVLSANGTPITTAGGVSIVWTNLTAVPNIVIPGDWVYVKKNELWQVVITYPNGCVYTATYFENCCKEDIHIVPIICPTAEQAELLIAQLSKASNYSSSEINAIRNTIEKYKTLSRADCNPCDIGYVLIMLVDGNGDPIVWSEYSIVWSDGGSGPFREIPVNTTISVTVTSNATGCVYEDEFRYDCDGEPCPELTAPTNLHVGGIIGTTLFWDPVPGAAYYVVSSQPAGGHGLICRCRNQISMIPITTTNNLLALPQGLVDKCFSWSVTAFCADGSSATSEPACYDGSGSSDGGHSFKILPNPSNGIFTLNLEGISEGTITITDIIGFTIYNANFKSQSDIDINIQDKPKGIYIVKVVSGNETYTGKIIKE